MPPTPSRASRTAAPGTTPRSSTSKPDLAATPSQSSVKSPSTKTPSKGSPSVASPAGSKRSRADSSTPVSKRPARAESAIKAASPSSSSPPPVTTKASEGTSRAAPPKKPALLSRALVFLGTYHNATAAYTLRGTHLTPTFTSKSHVGAVTAVASSAKLLVSSGTDEMVALHACKGPGVVEDLGSIAPPSQVNAMAFLGASAATSRHLAAALEDGTVAVYRVKDWTVGAVIKAHDRAASALAPHPGSGGLVGVSVGRDNLVAVLDFTTGTVIAHRKIDKVLGTPAAIKFSPDGAHFVVQTSFALLVYEMATVLEVARCTFERDPRNEIQSFALTAPVDGAAEVSFQCVTSVESGDFYQFRFAPVAAASATAGGTEPDAPAEKSKLVRLPPVKLPTKLLGDLPVLETGAVNTEDGSVAVLRPRVRAMVLEGSTLVTGTSTGHVQVLDLKPEENGDLIAVERIRAKTGGRITDLTVMPQ